MENGFIEESYVSTKDQFEDSLTKYLKGGENQQKANKQLSLIDMDNWLPGKGLVTGAKRVRFSDKVDLFEPKVKRIFLSGPDFSKHVGQVSLTKEIKENIEFPLL